jgi:hypothetical protein
VGFGSQYAEPRRGQTSRCCHLVDKWAPRVSCRASCVLQGGVLGIASPALCSWRPHAALWACRRLDQVFIFQVRRRCNLQAQLHERLQVYVGRLYACKAYRAQ